MFKSLTNIVKDVAEVTIKPVTTSVELITAPLAGMAKDVNDTLQETAEELRKGPNSRD